MRVFKNRQFQKWARLKQISDADLVRIVEELERGLCDASLGGSVYKKRMPLKNMGKSSGARSIVVYSANNIAVFMFGYTKNTKKNITTRELFAFRELGNFYLSMSEKDIKVSITHNELYEVYYD